MKIYFLLLAFLVINIVDASAQRKRPKGTEPAIVYMDNGSVLVGIIEDRFRDKFTLKFEDGQLVKIDMDDVSKLLDSKEAIILKNGRFYDINGFYWGINFGFNPFASEAQEGEEQENNLASFFETYFGWRFNKRLSLSGGMGFEFVESEVAGFNVDNQFLSGFIMGKYYITPTFLRVFAYSRIGYGYSIEEDDFIDDAEGGLQFQIGAGLKLPSKQRTKFIFSLGLHLQPSTGTESFLDPFGNEIDIEYDILIRRAIFKIGIELN